jgi:hypothetical protein
VACLLPVQVLLSLYLTGLLTRSTHIRVRVRVRVRVDARENAIFLWGSIVLLYRRKLEGIFSTPFFIQANNKYILGTVSIAIRRKSKLLGYVVPGFAKRNVM